MERIGRYEIQALIGRGGFGRVYRAWDPDAGRMVAVKVLQGFGSGVIDEELLKRFRREASTTGVLRHPNIVMAFEYGEHDSLPYLAMEFLEGRDLQQHIAAGGLSLLDGMSIMEQAAAGLQHAHRHGIVHRDVKPANLMVLAGGGVKIMDFGIARLSDEHSAQLTMAGHAIGTVAYMAPEQLRGEAVDHRADIFAFGVVLYELAAGAHPFRNGVADELPGRILSLTPPGVAGVPATLDRLIARALEKDPGSRYQSFEDLLFDLAPIRQELAAAYAEAAGPAEAARAPRPVRLQWALAAAALLVLGAAAAVAFVSFSPRAAPTSPPLPAPLPAPLSAARRAVTPGPPLRIHVSTDMASGWVALDGVAKGSLSSQGDYFLPLDDASPGEHLLEVAADEGGRVRVRVAVHAGGGVVLGSPEATRGLATNVAAGVTPPRLEIRVAQPVSALARPAAPAPAAPSFPPPPAAAPPQPPPPLIAPPPDALDAEIRRQEPQPQTLQAAPVKVRAEIDPPKLPAPIPAPAASADVPAILQTLASLRAAYANKDTAAIARLYPSVPKPLLSALKRDIDTLDLQFLVEGAPQVNGSTAVVHAQRSVATWFKGDRTPHAASDRVTIILRRAAGGDGAAWVVESMR